MLIFTLALLAAAPLDPRIVSAIEMIGEPGCPRLFPKLTPSFQKVAPAATWPGWCDSAGKLTEVTALSEKEGWQRFRARNKNGLVELGVGLADGDRIGGLYLKPYREEAASLDAALAQAGTRAKLPGVAAMAIVDGKVQSEHVWGVRKAGSDVKVATGDKWHLGSDTKAMTATLAAVFVGEGKIRWDSTVGEVLSSWKDLDPDAARLRLDQLLRHRAGQPSEVEATQWSELWKATDPVASRAAAVHDALRRKPKDAGAFSYSNMGYMIVGVMLEKVSGQGWEDLMRKKLFTPLGMRSCGFGVPATKGKVDGPWAHQGNGDVVTPVEPPGGDNPLGLGPAGTVHCSLADWARFATLHLQGARGEKNALGLDGKLFPAMHTPEGDYAFGWGVGKHNVRGKVLSHDGSNNAFYASIELYPDENCAFLVATNRAGGETSGAVHEIVDYMKEHRGALK